jgi:hypothetical protein
MQIIGHHSFRLPNKKFEFFSQPLSFSFFLFPSTQSIILPAVPEIGLQSMVAIRRQTYKKVVCLLY